MADAARSVESCWTIHTTLIIASLTGAVAKPNSEIFRRFIPVATLRKGDGMTMLKFFKPTLERPEIVEAIEAICIRYASGESASSIEFPPRFGKSTIVRGTALELRAIGAPLVVCLCPWRFLTEQINNIDDIQSMYERYHITDAPSFTTHRVEHVGGANWYEMSIGVPTLSSITIGLALTNKHPFLSGIEYCVQHYKERPVGIFDESQVVKKAQTWGKLAKEMQDLGCYIVTLTGTPVPDMPGFTDEIKDIKDVEYTLYRPRRNEKGEKEWFEENYAGTKSKINIIATKSVGWRDAWNAKPIRALEQANAIWIDTEVFNNDGVSLQWLSKISDDDTITGFLKPIIESDDVTNKMAYSGVGRLLRKQQKNPKTRMLVVTGADMRDQGSNQHARKFKLALQDALIAHGRSPKDLHIVVATSVDNNGDPDSSALGHVRKFRQHDGGIDVLIVKMMGLVGLDIPELKVLIYAGTVREGPLLRQAISRPLTVWSDCSEPADIVLPCDPKMRRRYNEIVEKQGGAAPIKSDVELVSEQPVPEPPLRDPLSNKGAKIFGYSDQTGKEFAGGDREYILAAIKAKYLVGSLTDVEILENYANGAFPVTQADIDTQKHKAAMGPASKGIIDLDADLPSLRGKFGEKAKQIVNKYIDFAANNDLWRKKVVYLQAEAKAICNVIRPVPKIDDAALLKKLIDALDQAEEIIFGV
jgi:hypothetical protein